MRAPPLAKFLFAEFVLLCLMLAAAGADPPVSAFFDANGVKIHYLTQGGGEPVVLIHGLYSSAEINWKLPGTMAALAEKHQVIALDLPGHGASDKPEDASAYGAQMAEDVVLLMDHLHVKKAHIVGYSLGGIVAGKVVAAHPDRVHTCILGGMGWLREGGGLQKVWELMQGCEMLGTPAACVKSVGQLALTEDQIKAVQVPVVMVVGDRDPVRKLYVTPLEQVRKDWPVVEIKDAGHINCIGKPQFVAEIVKWVDGHPGGVARGPATTQATRPAGAGGL